MRNRYRVEPRIASEATERFGDITVKNINVAAKNCPVITVLESSHGNIVKRFEYIDGEVRIQPTAQISRGYAQSIPAGGPSELSCILDRLAPNEAISLGRLTEIGRRLSLSSERSRRDGQVSRTKQFFCWHDGPAWALLDVDTKGLPPSERGFPPPLPKSGQVPIYDRDDIKRWLRGEPVAEGQL